MSQSFTILLAAAVVGILGALSYVALARNPEDATTPPPAPHVNLEPLVNNPAFDKNLVPTGHSIPGPDAKLEYATFGAGCFWGVEETFRSTKGVVATAVGYAGGSTENPSYKQVCYENTRHAEVVHLQFDPAQVSYDALLTIFWTNHNPTTLNRQGPDVGDQYRSVIFYHGETQRTAAEESKADLQASAKFKGRPIVTFIESAPRFYKAEDYHQQYLAKRGLSTCHTP